MKDNSREVLQKKLPEQTIIHRKRRPNNRHHDVSRLYSNSNKLHSSLLRSTVTHLCHRTSNASAGFTILESDHSCPHRFPGDNVHQSLDKLDNDHNTSIEDDQRTRSRDLVKQRNRTDLEGQRRTETSSVIEFHKLLIPTSLN